MRQAASELWRRIAYCAWHCHWQRPTDVVLPLDSCRCMGGRSSVLPVRYCPCGELGEFARSACPPLPLRSALCTLHAALCLNPLPSLAWLGMSEHGVAQRGVAGQGGSTAKAITAAPRAGRGMQTRLMERGLPMGGESVGGMRRGGTARALNHASCFMLHVSWFMKRDSLPCDDPIGLRSANSAL